MGKYLKLNRGSRFLIKKKLATKREQYWIKNKILLQKTKRLSSVVISSSMFMVEAPLITSWPF